MKLIAHLFILHDKNTHNNADKDKENVHRRN